MDGLELLSRLRARHNPIHVLATARDALNERVRGLNLGADDYLTKPFAAVEPSPGSMPWCAAAAARAVSAPRVRPLVLDEEPTGLALPASPRPAPARMGDPQFLLDNLDPGSSSKGAHRRRGLQLGQGHERERRRGPVSRLRAKLEPAGIRIPHCTRPGLHARRPAP